MPAASKEDESLSSISASLGTEYRTVHLPSHGMSKMSEHDWPDQPPKDISGRIKIPGSEKYIPAIGLGTWHYDEDGQSRSSPKPAPEPRKEGFVGHVDMAGGICQLALDLGYLQFDTASSYRTEQGVLTAVEYHTVPRAEVFITTKVERLGHTAEESREILLQVTATAGGGSGYVDLLLIDAQMADSKSRRQIMWLEMEKVYEEGKAK
jgi:diketogulonate reductase-like aldo/keto reductase